MRKMDKQGFTGLLILGILVLAVCAYLIIWQTTNSTETESTNVTSILSNKTYLVRITNEGFLPSRIQIIRGDTLVFSNEQSTLSWPASDFYPLNQEYPGSDVRKCGTAEQPLIFDACKGLDKDEQWRFRFMHAGTWGFHDHLNTNFTGSILVK